MWEKNHTKRFQMISVGNSSKYTTLNRGTSLGFKNITLNAAL